MAVKTFSVGEVLTASDTNTYLANAGLVYITSTTLSAVTNTISNCFSSTYDSYRIVCYSINNSTTTTRAFSLRVGTANGANYTAFEVNTFGAGTVGGAGATGQTQGKIGNLSQAPGQSFVLDIHNVAVATETVWTGQVMTYQSDVAGWVMRQIGGNHNVATAYTGFQIIGTTDNLSGNIIVYGYRKA